MTSVYIFPLLYNLYLLDPDYHEDFLGSVTSAMGLGSIAGPRPAATIIRKIGLERTVIYNRRELHFCISCERSHSGDLGWSEPPPSPASYLLSGLCR
jgi:hypothetical protein